LGDGLSGVFASTACAGNQLSAALKERFYLYKIMYASMKLGNSLLGVPKHQLASATIY
jgi:hypothetical protein